VPVMPCKDCGREVSTSAEKCPSCGRPYPTMTPEQLAQGVRKEASNASFWFFMLAAIFLVWWLVPALNPFGEGGLLGGLFR
jgi:hypothetical protein